MTYTRRGIGRNAVLVGLAVVIVIAAVVVYNYMGSRGDASKTEQVAMHCTKCNADYQISSYDFVRMMDKKQFKGGGAGASKTSMFFKCEKCGEFGAERSVAAPAAAQSAAGGANK
jgi:hypothetical protein